MLVKVFQMFNSQQIFKPWVSQQEKRGAAQHK